MAKTKQSLFETQCICCITAQLYLLFRRLSIFNFNLTVIIRTVLRTALGDTLIMKAFYRPPPMSRYLHFIDDFVVVVVVFSTFFVIFAELFQRSVECVRLHYGGRQHY